MKKFVLIFGVLFFLMGCEKRDPELSSLTDPNQEVVLTLWTADHADFFEALGKEFFASQEGSGAIQVQSFVDNAALEEALLHALAEDRGPDLLYTSGDWVAHNPAKILAAEPFEGLSLERLEALWVPSAQQTFLGEDSIYGVPLGVDTLGLIYNQDLLIDLAGQEDLDIVTWKELPLLASKLTQRNNSFERFAIAGMALGRVDNMLHLADVFQSILLQRDFALFTPDGTRAVLTQEGVNEIGQKYRFALDTLNFLLSFSDPEHANFSWNPAFVSAKEAFQDKKLALLIGSAQDVKQLDLPNMRVTFLPQFLSTDRKFTATPWGVVVPRKAALPQVAWQFLRFSHQSSIARSFHQETGLLSAQQPLLLEQEADEHFGVLARQVKTAQAGLLPLRQTKFRILFDQMVRESSQRSAWESLQWLEQILNR